MGAVVSDDALRHAFSTKELLKALLCMFGISCFSQEYFGISTETVDYDKSVESTQEWSAVVCVDKLHWSNTARPRNPTRMRGWLMEAPFAIRHESFDIVRH